MSAAHFSARWLRQREPFDAAARDLAARSLRLQSRLRALQPANGQPWRVMDLACGMGANMRWLAPRLGGTQEWLVVDHDAALLRRWSQQGPAYPEGAFTRRVSTPLSQPLRWTGETHDAAVVRQQVDLMSGLEQLPWEVAHLVTGSALLDLVGLDWLQRLVAAAARHRTPLLMALSVDGQHLWSIEDTGDALVERLFAQHQRRDKGVGDALGPTAVPVLRTMLEAAGYRVRIASSDWWLDGVTSAEAQRLQRALIRGMAAAAIQQDGANAREVKAWCQRRLGLSARTQLRVGHLDVWAVPI